MIVFWVLFYLQGSISFSHAGENTAPADFILKVGYFDFPGLTVTDATGKPGGLVNEITIKTLENTDINYTIKQYPAARFYEYLSEGKIHLFNGVSTIPIVKQSTISSDIPLFTLEMRIYHTKDKKTVRQKEALTGHSVILVRGFTYKDWGAWVKDPANKVEFYETDSHEAAFAMLKRQRGDYLLNYKHIDRNILKEVKIDDLHIEPLFRWECSFNISRNTPGAAQLLKKLEKSYQELIRTGKLETY